MRRDRLFWIGAGMVLAGLLLLLALLTTAMLATFTPAEGAGGYRPTTGPTTVPKPIVHLDKATLIIQQNVDCWGPGPGQDCGERFYR